MNLNEPIEIIKLIKEKMTEVIIENDYKYLNGNIDNLFIVYSADLCGILLNYYPDATIMMNKNYRVCGIMIEGVIYTSNGIADEKDYIIARHQEIGFIQKSFNHLSDCVLVKLNEKLYDSLQSKKGVSYKLRKNRENFT